MSIRLVDLLFFNSNVNFSISLLYFIRSLAVGSKNGYRLFAINNPDRLELAHEEG